MCATSEALPMPAPLMHIESNPSLPAKADVVVIGGGCSEPIVDPHPYRPERLKMAA
jgi:hypothetical protein